jgi:aryl-phospho-beta-D-glucosidase BglC (GH1 family)
MIFPDAIILEKAQIVTLNYSCWIRSYSLTCIIDLHASPGSQNGMEHSASRDGSVDWASPEYITNTGSY